MQVSVLLLQQRPFKELRAAAERWDRSGARAIYVADHLKSTPAIGESHWFEAFTVLGALSQVTTDIKLGTLVSPVTLHDPVQLALKTRTLDLLSDGRFELGIGAGGRPSDLKMRGLTVPSDRELADRLADTALIVDRLLRGEIVDHAGAASASGAQLTGESFAQPRPTLTIAAHGSRTLDTTARLADRWSASGLRRGSWEEQLAALGEWSSTLTERLRAHDRDPGSIGRSVLVGAYPGLTYESFEDLIVMAANLRILGFDELVIYDPPFALDDSPFAPAGVIDEILDRLDAFENIG